MSTSVKPKRSSRVEPLRSIGDLMQLKEQVRKSPKRGLTTLCLCDTGCRALGSVAVREALLKEFSARKLAGQLRFQPTGCHGFCEAGPLLVVRPQGILYVRVKAEDVPEILDATLKGEVVERLLYVDPATKEPIHLERDVPFYKHQTRLVFRHCGRIDPTDIQDYLALDGYEAIAKVLGGKDGSAGASPSQGASPSPGMTPEQVIAEVAASGLRGRGGAGFATGRKWQLCREAPGEPKYLICNADEGDPGAFMDRGVCEGDPHAILEGMLIGAYAIGCTHGYIYCRAEYPIAVINLTKAIADAEALGLLGDHILGTDFSFHLKIKQGAGAFVCGEETALIASIEGRRGMPRTRPPFPAQAGLFGKPTNINNVETFACVPPIIAQGSGYFASMGTEKSKGTKIFALAGKVKNTGLVEIPMGATLRQIIFDIGGGVLRDRKFKAAQMGGPSGGCVPAQYLDLPIDYDSLQAVGAIMGSGGLIVVDEDTCMVELARYFLDFVQSESCGKCVPCRVGTRRMLEMLTRITRGQGKEGDVELLQEIGQSVKAGSLCGLGQTAPNPVLSTIRYFRDEYDAHVHDSKCPARVCRDLVRYEINQEKCIACGKCKKVCPAEAIEGEKKVKHRILQDRCVKCGACYEACPVDAVVTA